MPVMKSDVPESEKKPMGPWVIGCIVAVVVLPIIVGVIGMLAAIAIPSFVSARNTAQAQACLNNLRIIESAKQQRALEAPDTDSAVVTSNTVHDFVAGNTSLICPVNGIYTYNPAGVSPECSVHGDLMAKTNDASNYGR